MPFSLPHTRVFDSENRQKIGQLLRLAERDATVLWRLLQHDSALQHDFGISPQAWAYLSQIKARTCQEFVDGYTDLLILDTVNGSG